MATVTNTIKKIEKLTGEKVNSDGNRFYVEYKGYILEFYKNGSYDDVVCISTMRKGLENDSMTDMFYNTWHNNITQAFKFLDRK